jgi:hypothetical protein
VMREMTSRIRRFDAAIEREQSKTTT